MSGNQRRFHLRHLAHRPHAVYVVWGGDAGDEALYVGMTSNWVNRIGSHMHYLRDGEAVHIDVWHAASNRADAEVLEAQTIRDLDPIHNRVHSPTHERREQEWAEYAAWAEAYSRHAYDNRITWAREPEALDRALEILLSQGYSGEALTSMHPTGRFSEPARRSV